MGFSGVNVLCKQCVHNCKQWEQVIIIACPKFLSNQKGIPKVGNKRRKGTLQSGQNA